MLFRIEAVQVGRRPCWRSNGAGYVGGVLGVDICVGHLVLVRIRNACGWLVNPWEEIFRGYPYSPGCLEVRFSPKPVGQNY